MSLHMALHLPVIYAAVLQEKKTIRKLVENHKIDLIISDNRFGCYAKNIPSVFITHQINIKTPHLSKWVNKLNQNSIKKFTQCWIPDFEPAPGLAGELSHPVPEKINAKYVGPLSRFTQQDSVKKHDLTVVLSGPEPQRTLLEDLLFKQLFELYSDNKSNLKINLVRGIYTSNEKSLVKNIQVYDHLSSNELETMLHESKKIICRAGYSGIMDLQYIDAEVLLIPTPQQTEQEYLAQLHSGNGKYFSQNQNEMNVEEFLKTDMTFTRQKIENRMDFNLLVEEIFDKKD